jgi:serine/threonine protein kinase
MKIGPYDVNREIGRGGMGVVYEAWDAKNNRRVAIKMIQQHAALSRSGRMGLVREARIAGQLYHPNVIRIYDIGQHKGWLYLVMEYLQGSSLDRLIQPHGALSLNHKLRILIQLSDALHYAHTFSVVHRDVKPANIFVLTDGAVKVVDFGLAVQSAIIHDASFAGTVPYMSPEAVSGGEIDCQSDIWSAGITMYELLTGRLPFQGATFLEVRSQILAADIPVVEDSLPLANDFNRVLGCALARDQKRRYPSIRMLRDDLCRLESLLEPAVPIILGSNETPLLVIGPLKDADRSKDPTQQNTEVVSQDLDVGFRCRSADTVEMRLREFRLEKLERRLDDVRDTVKWKALETVFRTGLQSVSLVPLFIFPLILLVVPLMALVVPVILLGSLLVRLLICVIQVANFLTARPRCRSCSRAMRRTGIWTRLVETNAEVVLGYRDCVAALRENLWVDAAKLLCIHGNLASSSRNQLISTPLRYHLAFHECQRCNHHAAWLTTDDLIENRWLTRIQFTEAYQGRTSKGMSALGKVLSMPKQITDIIASLYWYVSTLQVKIRLALGLAIIVLIFIASVFQGRHFRKAGATVSQGRRFERERTFRLADPPPLTVKALNARNKAISCYYGNGVPKNRLAAARWYESAAALGDGFSANELGKMYEKAMGPPQDFQKAVVWYRRGIGEGNSDAAMNLGRMYENGSGVDKDRKQAEFWYRTASNAGNHEAAERLHNLRTP